MVFFLKKKKIVIIIIIIILKKEKKIELIEHDNKAACFISPCKKSHSKPNLILELSIECAATFNGSFILSSLLSLFICHFHIGCCCCFETWLRDAINLNFTNNIVFNSSYFS